MTTKKIETIGVSYNDYVILIIPNHNQTKFAYQIYLNMQAKKSDHFIASSNGFKFESQPLAYAHAQSKIDTIDLLDACHLALRELRQFYNDSESEAIRVLKLAIDKHKI